jgi:uncharacterized protein
MNSQTQHFFVAGSAGQIECALDLPAEATPRGIALVAHPHPLFGGTMNNKVVTTIARALVQLGYVVVRSNFRGVGQTTGEHTAGHEEIKDLICVLQHVQTQFNATWQQLPVALAGFSFGAFVQTHVAHQLTETGQAIERLLLVGTATSRWEVLHVPDNTLVIHGEQDETVELSSVFDWARPQELPVVVIPGADHFFHKKLPILKKIILTQWQ